MRTIRIPIRLRWRRAVDAPVARDAEQRSSGEEAFRTAEQWWAEASAPGRPRLKSRNL